MYRLPNIVRVIKSRRLRWASHVARMDKGSRLRWTSHVARLDKGSSALKILTGTPTKTRPLVRFVDGRTILEWILKEIP